MNDLSSKPTVSGKELRWPQLKLTPAQHKAWEETRAATLWSQPAFSDIWYAMCAMQGGHLAWFTDNVPIAATDDRYMYLNPAEYFRQKLGGRVFIACHEICHSMFGHCGLLHSLVKQGHINYVDGLSLPFDADQFQIAMDFVINDILIVAKVGEIPTDPDNPSEIMVLHDPARVNGNMGVLEAYRAIYKAPPPSPKGGSGGPGKGAEGGMQSQQGGSGSNPSQGKNNGSGKGGFDKHLAPGGGTGKDPNEAMSERNETEWRTAIAGAIASAKLQGNLPGNLERLFGELMAPVVDWRELLRVSITNKLGYGSGSWNHLDTQMITRGVGAPGRVTHGAGLVVVAVDTSGSVDGPMLERLLSEVGGIISDVNPRELILVSCDAYVYDWIEIEGDLDPATKLGGGGGTRFEPVFERVSSEGLSPDMLVYLTDGYGSFPSKAPEYPVIWGNLTEDKAYPWGDVVFVPLHYKKGLLGVSM